MDSDLQHEVRLEDVLWLAWCLLYEAYGYVEEGGDPTDSLLPTIILCQTGVTFARTGLQHACG